jgi:hypoxanthine-DNA glycosylase
MGDLFAAGPELAYPQRLQILIDRQIALWDVIAQCHRPGSLDSAISADGMVYNDFKAFFEQHPCIWLVCFNGQKAASLFKKRVQPGLEGQLEYLTLPSTSPAHAAKSYAEKLEAWSIVGAASHGD